MKATVIEGTVEEYTYSWTKMPPKHHGMKKDVEGRTEQEFFDSLTPGTRVRCWLEEMPPKSEPVEYHDFGPAPTPPQPPRDYREASQIGPTETIQHLVRILNTVVGRIDDAEGGQGIATYHEWHALDEFDMALLRKVGVR